MQSAEKDLEPQAHETPRPPILSLRGVGKTVSLPPPAAELRILEGVDLTVHRGEHISIEGRSGSGKSTLLNIMGLLDEPTEGVMLLDGVPAGTYGDGARAKLRGQNIGFVFQQFNLLEGRTALENVMLPLLYSKGTSFWNRRSIALDVLDAVGLSSRAQSLPIRMSGGEQQRVAVARAIVKRPQLILADEPTGALDIATGAAVMSTLIRVAKECDAALITITHDIQVAAQADRHYYLNRGQLRVSRQGEGQ